MSSSNNYSSIMAHPPHPAAERIDRGATWSDPEVDELLNIWTDEKVQKELKEATIKKHIFERIARLLRVKGFYRTAEQCREKIKRLKKEYRQAKSNKYKCVRGRSTVKFFPRIEAVLDGNAANNNDGSNGAGRGTAVGNFGGDYVSPRLESARDGSGSATPNYLNGRGLPYSFNDHTSEEIKVEVNPAEVDNDSLNNSDDGDEINNVELPRHINPARHFSRDQFYNNALINVVTAHGLPSATAHALAFAAHSQQRQNHQALALTVNNVHHPINYSNNNNNTNGGLSGNRLSEDERECGSETSSSRATSPSSIQIQRNNKRPLSSSDSINTPRKKSRKRSCSFSVKETIDAALETFLKHQREAEERLYAFEERKLRLELEAEERWRQEDRDMWTQICIFSNPGLATTTTSKSTNTEPHSSPEREQTETQKTPNSS